MNLNRKHIFMVLIPAGIALFITGALSGASFSQRKNESCLRQFKFINPDVACGKLDVIVKTDYNETRNAILDFIKQEQEAGRAEEVSVYFRDLLRGPIFGINELAGFAPASLLKFPLGLVFMNSAETQPELLEYKIKYEGTTSVEEQAFKPQKSAQANQEYSIEELLKLMLIHSDNASYEALEAFLRATPERTRLRLEVYQELGLLDPKDKLENTITTRNYASLFRLLYNVSYLDPELAETILGWLAQSDFGLGLHKGVPPGISVAHKFGERLNDSQKQLHDCGIVYYPGNPYLVCIMTRGSDYQTLSEVIGTISKMIYEEVDSRKL